MCRPDVVPRFMNHCDEPIAAARSVSMNGLRRRVAERLADLRDAVVQPAIEVDERVAAPHALLQLGARDDFTRALDQHGKHARRLRLETRCRPVAPQFARALVELEVREANHSNPKSRIPNPAHVYPAPRLAC